MLNPDVLGGMEQRGGQALREHDLDFMPGQAIRDDLGDGLHVICIPVYVFSKWFDPV
jgi:hypothetical protein